MYRISQAGGIPSLITKLDESKGELGHLRPWFLPDGRHYIYYSRVSGTVASSIYLASLDGPDRARLVDSGQAAAYAPPAPGARYGHLLFLRDGTLMAQPMEPERYTLAGEPFPVAERVGAVLALGYFSVSANGVLAYRTGASTGASFSQLNWLDSSGKALETILPGPAYTGAIQLSPDGARAAVEQTDSTTNRDLWLVDLSRRIPTKFTFDRASDRQPVWSPDGSQVVFSSDREAAGRFSLYRKPSNGVGAEELILKSEQTLYPDSWSPDGRNLLYETFDQKTRFDLWLLPIGAGGAVGKPVPYLQGPFNDRQGQFSPDGRWVAYISDEAAQGSSVYHVYVQSFPPGAGKFQISSAAGATQPRWRRDGKELFYAAPDGRLMAAEVRTSPRFDSSVPRVLMDLRSVPGNASGLFFRYDVAPDGKRFLAIRPPAVLQSETTPITVVLNWQQAVQK